MRLFGKITSAHFDPIMSGFRAVKRQRTMRPIIFVQRSILEPKEYMVANVLFLDNDAAEDHDFRPVSIWI